MNQRKKRGPSGSKAHKNWAIKRMQRPSNVDSVLNGRERLERFLLRAIKRMQRPSNVDSVLNGRERLERFLLRAK